MGSTKPLRRRVRWGLGASTGSIVITLTLLVALGIAAWLGRSYYQLLSRAKKVEHSLDKVHRFRGVNRVTRDRLLKNALQQLRAAGGHLEAGDISLKIEALTLSNGHQLPRIMRTKISLACHMKKLQAVRDNRIERIKRSFATAGRPPSRAGRSAPAPVAPPDVRGGLGCSADKLAELDYSFVLLTAKAKVKNGWTSRAVTVTRKFYLPQPPSASAADENDSEDDDNE